VPVYYDSHAVSIEVARHDGQRPVKSPASG